MHLNVKILLLLILRVFVKLIIYLYIAKITLLKDKLFQEYDKSKKNGETLLQSITSPIISMSCRPHHNIVSFICENDQIFDWNFIEKPMKLEP